MEYKKRLSQIKMKNFEKYILACALFLCLSGYGNAQTRGQVRRKQKTEEISNDTMPAQTMTHTMPLQGLREPYIPKNPAIKFSSIEDALYIELQSFANAVTNDIKCVLSPVVVIKPFIRFYDKLDVGIKTTQTVQNYTDKPMTVLAYDMYTYAKLKTLYGDFSVQIGKFSALNYVPSFATSMPINNFFINMLSMNSGHYYPRAIVTGFRNKEMAIKIGYAEEDTKGFKFTGNGSLIIANEAFIEDKLKLGLLLTINNKNTIIDFQMACTPNDKNSLLLEIIDIGKQTGIHGTYKYSAIQSKLDIFVNGFKQFKDGVAGGSIGLRSVRTGTYAAIGATYHDPLHKRELNESSNELYDKLTPFAEFGVIYKFSH